MRVAGTVALDAGRPCVAASVLAGDVATALLAGVRALAWTAARDVAAIVRARGPALTRLVRVVRPIVVSTARAVIPSRSRPRLVSVAALGSGPDDAAAATWPPVDVPRPRRYELALPADPTAPGRARALLHEAAHDTAMVVTELVANAVDHAHTPSTLTLGFDGRGVSVAVRDGNATQGPRPRPVDPTAPRGRGLQMVEALAASWGVTVHPDGKTVWAVLKPGCYALGETSSGTA